MNLTSYSAINSKIKIFLLSIPVFFSNLALPMVGLVDTGLMGNLGETKYLAATSIATSIMTMIIWSFGFLRMGTVGIVSQLFGKSDYREIVRTLIRNLILALAIALIIILLKPILIKIINIYFTTTPETKELIISYISIRVFSIPAELIIYILIGFYLGLQKTNISSLIIIFLSSINIVLSTLFVLTYDLNIFGVALGTLIACYTTAILFTFFTYKFIIKNFQISPKFEKIISISKLLKLFQINFDIFVRTVLLTFSFLWVTYQGTKLGEDILAVNALLMQFVIIAAFFLDSYAFTVEGIVGYALGKRNKKSFILALNNSIQISFITSLIVSLIYLLFFKDIINILTDIEILKFISYKHILWVLIIPPAASFCYIFDGIYIGTSQTKEFRNCMIVSVVSFILISIYLTKFFGNHGLWFSLFIFMILRALTLRYYLDKILRKF